MSIVRIKKERNFVQINKEMLEEPELSLKTKGLISYCLTKPDDWQFHITQLASVLKEGERAIRSSINEAIKAGYAFTYQTRKENGDFGSWEIIITDSKETLKKYYDSIVSTGKVEIIFTERRFANAQVADAQNSRLLILEETKNEETNILNHHHQKEKTLDTPLPKIDDDDKNDDLKKKVKEFSSDDIVVTNTKGIKISTSQSHIFRVFTGKFKTETILKSIEKIRSIQSPVNDVFKYLEVTCNNIENNESREIKSKETTPIREENYPPRSYDPPSSMAELMKQHGML